MIANTIRMETQALDAPSLAEALLAWRPDAYTYIAGRLGVSRQHVREVAIGKRVSPRVQRAIAHALAGRRVR